MDRQLTGLFIIALAVTVLNTMPIWLVELAVKGRVSDVAVGLLASFVLLSAAVGCVIGALSGRNILAFFGGVVACLGIAVAAMVQTLSPVILFIGAGSVGFSLGVVLALPLSRRYTGTTTPRMIGNGMAIGCAASFVLLVVIDVTELPLLPFLALLSAIQVALVTRQLPVQDKRSVGHFNWKQDSSLLPFFVCMGAYWAFLEVFSVELNIGSLSAWLAASLLLSGLGSYLAGLLPNRLSLHARLAGLLLAAFAGGLTYLSKSEVMIGATVLVNAFGLFLFFPLYLDRTDAPATGMARYLLGFALGGVIGSLAISVGGYPALAVAVAVSGLIAVPATARLRPKPESPGF